MKGFLYLRGVEEARGHSVRVLCDEAVRFDPTMEELQGDAAGLDVFNIPTRYPNGLRGGLPADAYDELDSERALARAGRIIDRVAAAFAG